MSNKMPNQYNQYNSNNRSPIQIPRYYSADHRAKILAIQERSKRTPAEEYINGMVPVIMSGCTTCGNTNNSYSYRAGSNGGAPM